MRRGKVKNEQKNHSRGTAAVQRKKKFNEKKKTQNNKAAAGVAQFLWESEK